MSPTLQHHEALIYIHIYIYIYIYIYTRKRETPRRTIYCKEQDTTTKYVIPRTRYHEVQHATTDYDEVRDITKCEIPRSTSYHEVEIPEASKSRDVRDITPRNTRYRKERDSTTKQDISRTRYHEVRDATKYGIPLQRSARYHEIRDIKKYEITSSRNATSCSIPQGTRYYDVRHTKKHEVPRSARYHQV